MRRCVPANGSGRRQAGIADPYEEHHKRPLAEHLDDFEAALLRPTDTGGGAFPVAQTADSGRADLRANENLSRKEATPLDNRRVCGWLRVNETV
jgi:hypothetical protein